MANTPDQTDDDIFDEGEMEDDGTAAIIRKAFEDAQDDDADDDGGFDQPLEPRKGEEPDVVSPETGRDLLDDAEMARAKGKVPGEKTGDATDDAKPDADKDATADADKDAAQGDADKDAAKPDDASELGKAGVDTLLEGLPDERRAEVTKRLRDADQAMAPFKNAYIQGQMKEWGSSPTEVASRLVELASFAREKPHEYIAWVANQSASPEKMGELLTSAAGLLGYKVVKAGDGDDDDMFDDPDVKRLREENAQLRAKIEGEGLNFGPDTPERQQARSISQQIQNFTTETDEAGNLKRPLFNQVRPRIVELANAQRAATGKPGTLEDLQRFYDQSVEEARRAFGNPATPAPAGSDSAAQPQSAVADRMSDKAASAQRALRASKSVDGTGQGASRRPALSADASLEDVIRHYAKTD